MDENLVPGTLRAGAFGEFVIYGNPYRKKSAPLNVAEAWCLTVVNPWTQDHQETINDYWVCGEEFRSVVKEKLLEGLTPASTFILGENPVEPPEAGKRAALQAIINWRGKAANS